MIQRLVLAALALSSSCVALAQAAPTVLTLSDAEKAEILSRNGTAGPDDAPPALDEIAPRPTRGIHGEMGVMVGTNGTRAAYGSAAVPIGENAAAGFSFETSRYRWGR